MATRHLIDQLSDARVAAALAGSELASASELVDSFHSLVKAADKAVGAACTLRSLAEQVLYGAPPSRGRQGRPGTSDRTPGRPARKAV